MSRTSDSKLKEAGTYCGLACSRLLDSGGNAKEKGTRKVGEAGKKKKKGEKACNHFFRELLPPTFGPFEIIKCRLSNGWNVNELESFSNFTREIWPIRGYTRSWYTGTGSSKKWLQDPPPLLSPVSSVLFSCLRFLNSADYLGAWNNLTCSRLRDS